MDRQREAGASTIASEAIPSLGPGTLTMPAPTAAPSLSPPEGKDRTWVMPARHARPYWRGGIGAIVVLLLVAGLSRSERLSREAAFVVAAQTGDTKTVRAYLESGGDPNALGGRALSTAARLGNVPITRLLLAHHANPQISLEEAALHGQDETLALLLDAGGDLRGERGGMLLCSAAQSGDTDTIYLLLRHAAPIEACFAVDGYMTPLMFAARSGKAAAVYAFVSSGARVRARSVEGRNALMYAALWNQPAACKYLIAAGADVNARDNEGRTPLMHGVLGRNIATVDYLLACGASVSGRDRSGKTALAHAIEVDDARLINRLRRAGATL